MIKKVGSSGGTVCIYFNIHTNWVRDFVLRYSNIYIIWIDKTYSIDLGHWVTSQIHMYINYIHIIYTLYIYTHYIYIIYIYTLYIYIIYTLYIHYIYIIYTLYIHILYYIYIYIYTRIHNNLKEDAGTCFQDCLTFSAIAIHYIYMYMVILK